MEQWAVAKNDVQVLMEDGHFSNFRTGNRYRCVTRQDGSVVLMDENKHGYICDNMEEFSKDFEMAEDKEPVEV